MSVYRVACIGLGGYARHYVEAMIPAARAGRVRVDALVDPHPPAALASYLAAFGPEPPAVYAGDADLYAAHGNLDVVFIGTPIYLHEAMVVRALEAGCHVLCAKPATSTIQAIDRMRAAAARAGRKVLIDFQHIYAPATQRIKAAVHAGTLGRVHTILAKMVWQRDDGYYRRNPGSGKARLNGHYVLDGPLCNPHSHYIMNALYFAHPGRDAFARPDTVQAELYRCRDIECEDTAAIRCRTDTGVEILLYSSLCGFDREPWTEIEVLGDRGRAVWQSQVVAIEAQGAPTVQESHPRGSSAMVVDTFLDVLDGKASGRVGLEEARQHVLFANGAYEAAGTIHALASPPVERMNLDGRSVRVLPELRATVERAARERKLFSEINLPWAHAPGAPFSLEGYRNFNLVNW